MYDYENAEEHVRRIKVLLKLGRYEEALREYDKLISIEPGNHNFYFRKTSILIKIAKYEDALYEINRALSVNPDSSLYHFCKAYLLEKVDEPLEAIHEIDLASKLSSKGSLQTEETDEKVFAPEENKIPELVKKNILSGSDEIEDPDTILFDLNSREREIFFDDDMSGTFGLDKVNKFKDLWKFHEALTSMDRLVTANGEGDEEIMGISFSSRVRRFDSLITSIIDGTELYRNPAYSEYASDLYLRIPEEHDRNLMKMNVVIRKSPANADYRYGKGLMLFSKGRLPEALDAINKAIGLNPSKLSFNYGKEIIREKMKQIDDALEEITIAVDSTYNNPYLHYLKSILLYMDGNMINARKEVEIAVSMNPSNILYHFLRKIVLKSPNTENSVL